VGVLAGRPEGKSPLVRPRLRWEDMVTVNLQEVGWRAWTESIWLWMDRWQVPMDVIMKVLYDLGGACSMNGERRGEYRVLVGKPGEIDHLEDPDTNGRIILRWIFRKWDGVALAGSIWPIVGMVVGCDEHSNESII